MGAAPERVKMGWCNGDAHITAECVYFVIRFAGLQEMNIGGRMIGIRS